MSNTTTDTGFFPEKIRGGTHFVYKKDGHIATYSNTTQAEKKCAALKLEGHECHVTASHPFLIILTSPHKSTGGNWSASPIKTNPDFGNQKYFSIDTDRPVVSAGDFKSVGFYYPHSLQTEEEMIANAKLIAEAGTVLNKTGFTPLEIAKQRDELLQALKVLKINLIDIGFSEMSNIVVRVAQTIHKTKKPNQTKP
jgi:hypothetical protein